ncbi:MAG: IS1182 family transposase [Eubacteriales bacterium]|nr:IS1182 family transposase [Eubacteriales bacterium]
MLRDTTQIKLSQYRGLYDVIVSKDNLLRKIKENIDCSFVNPMLKDQYCEHFGRPAKEPEMMFKLLFLKKLYDLLDEALIQNTAVNMAYKYFLDLDPEDDLIDSSLLTKFRKTRITEDILEEMLKETISQAIKKGLIKSTAIIVDSTHTNAAVRPKRITQVLRDLSKQLRKEIYKTMYDLSANFPERPSEEADLEEEIVYTRQLLENTEKEIQACEVRKIRELYERIKELIETNRIREIRSKDDEDAHFGHKTIDSTFFGYKNNLAMTEERIITGIEVTGGGAPDGKQLEILVEKSRANGIEVKEVIGDTAFSSMENIDFCEESGIQLIAKSNPVIATAAAPKDDGFAYNKDAGTMQCPAGELAMRVDKRTGRYKNQVWSYCFSKKKCTKCPFFSTCKVGISRTKTYNVTITSERNQKRLVFQQSEYFGERLKIRYRIEEKHGELKQAHGLRIADSTGLEAMRLQMFFTAFAVNVKRIVRLMEKTAV